MSYTTRTERRDLLEAVALSGIDERNFSILRTVVFEADRFHRLRAEMIQAKQALPASEARVKEMEEGLAKADKLRGELAAMEEIRGAGCQCGDDDACRFVLERDEARAELRRLREGIEGAPRYTHGYCGEECCGSCPVTGGPFYGDDEGAEWVHVHDLDNLLKGGA
jgi:hypothetical protein